MFGHFLLDSFGNALPKLLGAASFPTREKEVTRRESLIH